jgi:hypothetical protein
MGIDFLFVNGMFVIAFPGGQLFMCCLKRKEGLMLENVVMETLGIEP